MKKLLLSALLVAFAAAPALAANAPTAPTTLKAKNGNVTFNHKSHAKVDCKTCHTQGTPGKIELDKDSAHKLCMGCHKEKGAGPSKCGECHKK